MARRAGTRQRWLSAAATPLLLAAGAPPAPVPAPVSGNADMKHADASTIETAAPDPALLDYLGRYGEAADDVDPLGFDLPAEPPLVPARSKPGKEPR